MNYSKELSLQGLKYHKVSGLDYYLVSSLDSGKVFNITTNEDKDPPTTITLDDIKQFILERRVEKLNTKIGALNV